MSSLPFVISEGLTDYVGRLQMLHAQVFIPLQAPEGTSSLWGDMTTGNMDVGRRAEMIAQRAEMIARREDCPTTLGERGGGGAMATQGPQQPHNAAPLRPVLCFPPSRNHYCVHV